MSQSLELRNPVETIHKHCDAWKLDPVSSKIIIISIYKYDFKTRLEFKDYTRAIIRHSWELIFLMFLTNNNAF